MELRPLAFTTAAAVVIILRMSTATAGETLDLTAADSSGESLKGRGKQMFGDKCNETKECGFRHSICDSNKKQCQCDIEFDATNHYDLCGKAANLNETCEFKEQCEAKSPHATCTNGICVCIQEHMVPVFQNGALECLNAPRPTETPHPINPAMIGILAGMALMFIIICVVLRLFSKARWRENRSIFNTPNPRLMNASLLQHHKKDERRGSRGSVRGPSRAPSISSLRPHSPAVSQGSKRSRSNSKGSNSSTKDRSPTKQANNAAIDSAFVNRASKADY